MTADALETQQIEQTLRACDLDPHSSSRSLFVAAGKSLRGVGQRQYVICPEPRHGFGSPHRESEPSVKASGQIPEAGTLRRSSFYNMERPMSFIPNSTKETSWHFAS